MDKRKFVVAVSEKLRVSGAAAIPQDAVSKVLDAVADVAATELKKSGTVRVPGLVTFTVKDRRERIARNPRTGEECIIKAGKNVRCKPVTAFAESTLS